MFETFSLLLELELELDLEGEVVELEDEGFLISPATFLVSTLADSNLSLRLSFSTGSESITALNSSASLSDTTIEFYKS